MNLSLSTKHLARYLSRQLENTFPDGQECRGLRTVVERAVAMCKTCFERVALKHFHAGSVCRFNHLNADQYAIFIYFCSRVAFVELNDQTLATKLFYLNKVLHQFHCMYDTQLPSIFLVVHGTGIVLGKAQYSDYLVISQHCTVGASARLEYPTIGEFAVLYPGANIVGSAVVGKNTCFASSSFVNGEIVPDDRLVIGRSPDLIMKPNRPERFDYFFRK